MFKPHNAICTECSNFTLVVVKKGLCAKCNYELKQSKKKAEGKDTKKKTYVKKPTGELELFRHLCATREHKCFICKKPLYVLTVSNFMHVIPKGKCEKLRLVEENIVIGCHDFESSCHDVWDKQPRSKIKDNPIWKPIFELEEKLKNQYKSVTI